MWLFFFNSWLPRHTSSSVAFCFLLFFSCTWHFGIRLWDYRFPSSSSAFLPLFFAFALHEPLNLFFFLRFAASRGRRIAGSKISEAWFLLGFVES